MVLPSGLAAVAAGVPSGLVMVFASGLTMAVPLGLVAVAVVVPSGPAAVEALPLLECSNLQIPHMCTPGTVGHGAGTALSSLLTLASSIFGAAEVSLSSSRISEAAVSKFKGNTPPDFFLNINSAILIIKHNHIEYFKIKT